MANSLAKQISCLVEKILTPVDENIPQNSFFSCQKPSISIESYLLRFFKFFSKKQALYVCMLIYLDRYLTKSGVNLSFYNVHRLLACCFLMAVKFSIDSPVRNSDMAKIAGITGKELNHLELSFLNTLNHQLFISEEEYTEATRIFKLGKETAPWQNSSEFDIGMGPGGLS